MKAYIPFGDWSKDGHGQCAQVLVSIGNMRDLVDAQNKIKSRWGDSFFEGYAANYEEPYLAPVVWEALAELNMPIEFLQQYNSGYGYWNNFKTLAEALNTVNDPPVSLEFVEQSFIWLLNQFGAGIIILVESQAIPQINNWTAPGFETVGYGCFDDY